MCKCRYNIFINLYKLVYTYLLNSRYKRGLLQENNDSKKYSQILINMSIVTYISRKAAKLRRTIVRKVEDAKPIPPQHSQQHILNAPTTSECLTTSKTSSWIPQQTYYLSPYLHTSKQMHYSVGTFPSAVRFKTREIL